MYKPEICASCDMPVHGMKLKTLFRLNAAHTGKDDRKKRLKNNATKIMAKNMAGNPVYYSQLLKLIPLNPKS